MRNIACYLVLLALSVAVGAEARSDADPSLFIEFEIDAKSPYEHQTFVATPVLYTTSPDIAYINRLTAPEIENGSFEVIRIVPSADNRATRKEIKGKEYYRVPLESFVMAVDKKGTYSIVAPSYDIGVSVPTVVRDPFWGTYRTSRTTSCRPETTTARIKVKSVPDAPSGSAFSGSVGEFNIQTVIPKGDIIVGEEATALIIVSGPGIISESVLPEYRSAFGSGLNLKSVSESCSSHVVDGRLVSELQLECTFIPSRREDVSIGAVSFDFFNPVSGKFETIRSAPVEVQVKSTVSRREKISV